MVKGAKVKALHTKTWIFLHINQIFFILFKSIHAPQLPMK
jgi:hypothetical protein